MEQNQIIPSDYNQAAEIIKTAILQGQYEALKDENRVQLAVYFGVGKYVSINSRKGGAWGTGALEAISERLRKILPGLRGFSANSLKNMRKFYEQWSMLDKSTITNVETTNTKSTIAIVDLPDAIESIDIYHSLSFPDTVSFPVEDFLHTPFTHHIRIIEKIDNINERYYYIHRCANEYLSVEALKRLFKEDAYHNQQQIPNNFTTAKISAKEARKAVMMFKDEYALDFINVEEIGVRDNEDIDERVVEQQIVQNIKRFIMTFGNDFAFIGNQYHLEVYGVEHFSDLLFFNRELNAIVCVELKVGTFKLSYLGQLTAYLRILDDHVKKSHENPSIGIVLCKSAKREYVEYIIQDFDKPMGVATYTTVADMPEDLRKALPDMDELKKLL